MTLTSIMVAKHSKWYLQMSETLPMPISFARRCHQARNVQHFDFALTCDVTRDPEVNTVCFLWAVFPGLSNAASMFRIGPVVSEIRGGGGSK